MIRRGLVIVAVLGIVGPVAPARAAEPVPAWPVGARAAADWLSTGAVAAQLGADLWHAYRAPDRRRALERETARIVVTVAVAEIVKQIVDRPRPDGSDHHSFYSEHTAVAGAAAGWRVGVSIPIAVGVGYLRLAADKHFPTDVAVGAVAAAGVARLFPRE